MKSFGLDPAYERRGLYSMIGYFEPIDWASRHRLHAISFGVNVIRAKCLRGCRHRLLVGCAFERVRGPTAVRLPAAAADELHHVATCSRQL